MAPQTWSECRRDHAEGVCTEHLERLGVRNFREISTVIFYKYALYLCHKVLIFRTPSTFLVIVSAAFDSCRRASFVLLTKTGLKTKTDIYDSYLVIPIIYKHWPDRY